VSPSFVLQASAAFAPVMPPVVHESVMCWCGKAFVLLCEAALRQRLA
jgi:hypothetical protein